MSGPSARFIASGSQSIAEILATANAAGAVEDGRVFVDGSRVADASVTPRSGSSVEVYAPRTERPALRVIAQHEGLLFVDKPVGVATEPERRGTRTSLVHRIAEELGLPPEEVHALSRLDVGVSGLVLLGLTPEARKRVQMQRERGAVRRLYVAIAAGVPSSEAGLWDEAIGKAGRGPLRAATPGAQTAATAYRVTGAVRAARHSACVLALEPRTGRTHQLRVHAAHHGSPLYGDTTYGGPGRLVAANGSVAALDRVFLHAAWVSLPGVGRIECPLPAEFARLWSELGGSAEALEAARLAADPSSG